MEFYEFFNLMINFFPAGISGKRGTSAKNEFLNITYAFMDSNDKKEFKISDMSSKDSFYRGIKAGTEKIPTNVARWIRNRINYDAFSDFYDLEDLSDNREDELEKILLSNGASDEDDCPTAICKLFEQILDKLLSDDRKANVERYQIVGKYAVAGKKRIKLPNELIPNDGFLTEENKYIDALLKVYSQDSGESIKTVSDLKDKPIYEENLKLQREDFYKAVNLFRNLRDVFINGEEYFTDFKDETYELTKTIINRPFSNGMDRLNKTMLYIIEDTTKYTKSYIASDGKGFVGPAEKRGTLHILVNDGKVEWIKAYDEE